MSNSKNKTLSTRITEELYDAVKGLAETYNVTTSEVMRENLKRFSKDPQYRDFMTLLVNDEISGFDDYLNMQDQRTQTAALTAYNMASNGNYDEARNLITENYTAAHYGEAAMMMDVIGLLELRNELVESQIQDQSIEDLLE